mgnify:CR=1 FL=1
MLTYTHLLKHHIETKDGELGKVKDIYFDDSSGAFVIL